MKIRQELLHATSGRVVLIELDFEKNDLTVIERLPPILPLKASLRKSSPWWNGPIAIKCTSPDELKMAYHHYLKELFEKGDFEDIDDRRLNYAMDLDKAIAKMEKQAGAQKGAPRKSRLERAEEALLSEAAQVLEKSALSVRQDQIKNVMFCWDELSCHLVVYNNPLLDTPDVEANPRREISLENGLHVRTGEGDFFLNLENWWDELSEVLGHSLNLSDVQKIMGWACARLERERPFSANFKTRLAGNFSIYSSWTEGACLYPSLRSKAAGILGQRLKQFLRSVG